MQLYVAIQKQCFNAIDESLETYASRVLIKSIGIAQTIDNARFSNTRGATNQNFGDAYHLEHTKATKKFIYFLKVIFFRLFLLK